MARIAVDRPVTVEATTKMSRGYYWIGGAPDYRHQRVYRSREGVVMGTADEILSAAAVVAPDDAPVGSRLVKDTKVMASTIARAYKLGCLRGRSGWPGDFVEFAKRLADIAWRVQNPFEEILVSTFSTLRGVLSPEEASAVLLEYVEDVCNEAEASIDYSVHRALYVTVASKWDKAARSLGRRAGVTGGILSAVEVMGGRVARPDDGESNDLLRLLRTGHGGVDGSDALYQPRNAHTPAAPSGRSVPEPEKPPPEKDSGVLSTAKSVAGDAFAGAAVGAATAPKGQRMAGALKGAATAVVGDAAVAGARSALDEDEKKSP